MLSRANALNALTNRSFDVLVIGGGATGAGVALDAVTRGYSVALVEKHDYASGTSSRSSKLIHGGLRYLQKFDLGLVREALLERQLNASLAPHIVRALPIIVPAFEGARPDRLLGLGLNMYDVMAVGSLPISKLWRPKRNTQSEPSGVTDISPTRHRTISGEEVERLIPALKQRAPTGGYLFYDCQTDDVRLVLTILEEAVRGGAICANGLEATKLIETDQRARGVKICDRYSGENFEIYAENIVNATGVWADRIRPSELRDEADVPLIRPSRGTHILIPQSKLPLSAGAIAPAAGRRTIFVLPWLGMTLIGTTDNDYEGSLDHIIPPGEDIDYLLDATNSFFGKTLTRSDIAGAFAGVRPLVSSGDPKRSVDISRKAELYETSSGMITITGGKLTTWRRMAKMTVDRIVERSGKELPCRTDKISLGVPIEPERLSRLKGEVSGNVYDHLAGRYGTRGDEVLAIAKERRGLASQILPNHPDLLAEAVYAVRYQQAQTISDVMFRRTRLGILGARQLCGNDSKAVKKVAKVMAKELGWNRRRRAREVEAFFTDAKLEGVVVSEV